MPDWSRREARLPHREWRQPVVGNTETGCWHRLDCWRPQCQLDRVRSSHLVVYRSAAAARAAGLRPCGHCWPGQAPYQWALLAA